MSVRNELSAGGIVFRPGKKGPEILLIKDHNGKWTFPKGHVEDGEEPDAAAVREVAEETGIGGLSVRGEIGKTDYYFKNKWDGSNDTIHKTVRYYLLEADAGDEPNPPQDWTKGVEPIADAKWFFPQEAQKRSGYKDNRKLLGKTVELLERSRQIELFK